MVKIRKAKLADAGQIAYLVDFYYRRGDLLPRSLDEIYESIRDWIVAEENGQIVGCGSLVIMGCDPSAGSELALNAVKRQALAEVRSLAIRSDQQGKGLGQKIVAKLFEEAQELGITTLFALTRAVPFFEKMGFQVTERERFPRKIWKDCVKCPVFTTCDEVAVAMEVPAVLPVTMPVVMRPQEVM